jgi:acetyl esterase/lipase
LDRENYAFVAEALTSQGFNVVIPDYRLYPDVGISEIMDDARHAVEWVNNNIHIYHGDSSQIILMGHSAGAHIAALLTLDERYLSPSTYQNIRGFIGLAGPYDFLPLTEDYQKKVFGPEANYANTQPVNFVDGSEPPIMLLYGKQDTTVKIKNIKSLSQKIKGAGGQVITHYYSGLDHTGLIGSLSIPLRNGRTVLSDIIQFSKNVSANKTLSSTP